MTHIHRYSIIISTMTHSHILLTPDILSYAGLHPLLPSYFMISQDKVYIAWAFERVWVSCGCDSFLLLSLCMLHCQFCFLFCMGPSIFCLTLTKVLFQALECVLTLNLRVHNSRFCGFYRNTLYILTYFLLLCVVICHRCPGESWIGYLYINPSRRGDLAVCGFWMRDQ